MSPNRRAQPDPPPEDGGFLRMMINSHTVEEIKEYTRIIFRHHADKEDDQDEDRS